jgi:hypothetical protein
MMVWFDRRLKQLEDENTKTYLKIGGMTRQASWTKHRTLVQVVSS